MFKQTSLLLLGGALLCSGCSRTTQNRQTAAQAIVNSVTGDAQGSRNSARALRSESDALLAAKDYNGAMGKRLEILAIRSKNTTMLSALSSYSTQSLAVADLAKIASNLDAASCRKYAGQLQTVDAQIPTFPVILQGEEADQLKMLARITRTPQEWQTTVAGLRFTPQQRVTLQNMPAAQVQSNIHNAYAALGKWSQQLYSSTPLTISGDPYTTRFAVSPLLNLSRFFWTKSKTERLLAVAALRQRADRLEKKKRAWALPADPFGTGTLKEKGAVIYSVGPDTKDDGGKPIPSPMRLRISDLGDMRAPAF